MGTLDALEVPRAGLLLTAAPESPWQVLLRPNVFRGTRTTLANTDTRLRQDKAFHFIDAGEPLIAYNIIEFHQAIQSAPLASLRHHLSKGDFSRWVREVIGDEQLARGLRKLERSTLPGSTLDRSEILAHIEDHYLIKGNEMQ